MSKVAPAILIGGAPTTGKSVMAQKIAARLNMPWISSDQLRDVVRPYADKERFPTLYDSQGMTAEEFLERYSAQEICSMEFAQAADVWPAIQGLVSNTYNWVDGYVIEGVNVLPRYVAPIIKDNPRIKPVFLIDLDRDRMREVVYTRGLFDDADTYSDHVKDKEVEWAMMFAQELQAEAEKHGLPVLHVSKTDQDVDRAIELLGL